MSALFACSRCFSRHPFEELSPGQQLCKECRGAFPVVKCTFCRSEFQQTNSKGFPSSICKKCEQNVKQFGKPTACEYCNIIAAFIGNKCQRCTNSEKRYGPPVTCEQCKQKCAFDRKDEDKKIANVYQLAAPISPNSLFLNPTTSSLPSDGNLSLVVYTSQVDGKLLCWLCTLSFKRALAKTKQSDTDRRAHNKMVAQRAAKNKEHAKHKGHNKRPHRVDVTKISVVPDGEKDGGGGPPPAKAPRVGRGDPHDPNSSDHVIAMTQLKEQIASLTKQLSQKDMQLLSKDKMLTELKAKHFTIENEFRTKMKKLEREYNDKVEMLNTKIKTQIKELATHSKNTKKQSALLTRELATSNSGSGTDSPSLA